jgi:hypothetical protein
VRKKGRQRVISSGRKNVHAFVRGTLKSGNWSSIAEKPKSPLVYDSHALALDGWVEVTYNPYMFSTFVVKATGQPIMKADKVLIINSSVYAKDGV